MDRCQVGRALGGSAHQRRKGDAGRDEQRGSQRYPGQKRPSALGTGQHEHGSSVIVGATPYRARARHTRNPVSLKVCTTSDAPTAMIAPASVGTSSSAVNNPQHNRRPGRPRTRRTRTAPARAPGLAAPGPTRVGGRKERGGLTELNGTYQGREGLPKFTGTWTYARPEIM